MYILAGMFALGAQGSDDPAHYMKLGHDIVHTCHESYDRSGKLHFVIVCFYSF